MFLRIFERGSLAVGSPLEIRDAPDAALAAAQETVGGVPQTSAAHADAAAAPDHVFTVVVVGGSSSNNNSSLVVVLGDYFITDQLERVFVRFLEIQWVGLGPRAKG